MNDHFFVASSGSLGCRSVVSSCYTDTGSCPPSLKSVFWEKNDTRPAILIGGSIPTLMSTRNRIKHRHSSVSKYYKVVHFVDSILKHGWASTTALPSRIERILPCQSQPSNATVSATSRMSCIAKLMLACFFTFVF